VCRNKRLNACFFNAHLTALARIFCDLAILKELTYSFSGQLVSSYGVQTSIQTDKRRAIARAMAY